MIKISKKNIFSKIGLFLIFSTALLITIIMNISIKGFRIDLTEHKLYTLSDSTIKLISSLQKPIEIKLFYSKEQIKDIPSFRVYANRVIEFLNEYVLFSKGNLKLTVINPEPFSIEEDQANQLGIQAVPINEFGDKLYFGISLTSPKMSDKNEIIEFLHPDKELLLEYELSKAIYGFNQDKNIKIGLINGLLDKKDVNFLDVNHRPQDLVSIAQLKQMYDVEDLAQNFTEVPSGLSALVIIQPKLLSENTLYAIDQFILAGGNALVMVDPKAESDHREFDHERTDENKKTPSIDKLLEAWGIAMDNSKIIADADLAMQVSDKYNRIMHLTILGIDQKHINHEDPSMAFLKKINMSSAGALIKHEEDSFKISELIYSSNNSMLIDADKLEHLSDPTQLYKDFSSTNLRYPIAVRITGKIKSAFDKEVLNESSENSKATNQKNRYVKESIKSVNIIVISDTDWLIDHMWVQKTQFFGQQVIQTFANNGDMLINMVDSLTGSGDLVNIRGKSGASRPFIVVDNLERKAQETFYATQQRLEQKLQITENKLRDVQNNKLEGSENSAFNSEQQKEIEKFLQEKIKIRHEIRDVKHQLNKSIENLGKYLKIINIFLIPFLMILSIFIYILFNRKRMP